VTLNRWELLRALGAAAADPAATAELGLPPAGTAGHDEVFAFNCPPYASLYLGEDGGRLAALWAGTGPGVPTEPDHLAALLDRYAGLGEAGEDGTRQVLFREFLWPWLPAYLGSVCDLPAGPLTRWAELALTALRREREQDGELDGPLPRALREAPAAGPGDAAGLIDGLLTPLRSGVILTRRAVAAGADQVGAGQRTGNRRRALGIMLAAEPQGTVRWLADEADRWSRRHQAVSSPGDRVQQWWADRAAGTDRLLRSDAMVSAAG
jgi:hypothetical protein